MGAGAPARLGKSAACVGLERAEAPLAAERGEDTESREGTGASGCARGDSAAWGSSGCCGSAEEAGLRPGAPIRAGKVPELRDA